MSDLVQPTAYNLHLTDKITVDVFEDFVYSGLLIRETASIGHDGRQMCLLRWNITIAAQTTTTICFKSGFATCKVSKHIRLGHGEICPFTLNLFTAERITDTM